MDAALTLGVDGGASGARAHVVERLADGSLNALTPGKSLDWNVQLVDTGDETDTGGRIEGCKEILGDRFIATYADGLSDVPIEKLLAFHDSHGGAASAAIAGFDELD